MNTELLPHMNPQNTATRAILLINNPISADMSRMTLDADGIRPEEVTLITLRQTLRPWFDQCRDVLHYPAAPSLRLTGQWRFLGFYWRAARLLNRELRSPHLEEIYIVNNDNLLTNHALAWRRQGGKARITVISEGLMNYIDVQPRNRGAWRHRTKRLIAGSLGLLTHPVTGHLSGSFDPTVSRVISFVAAGLFAPQEKVVILPFQPVTPSIPPQPNTLLYVETALWPWMPQEQWQPIARAFAAWIRQQNPSRLLVKEHPSYPACPLLRSLLPPFELLPKCQSIEEMAPNIEAAHVVGTCCTGLVTLRLIRPDLQISDFGANRYIPAAYHNDFSVVHLMREVGVRVVDCPGGEQPDAAIA